MFRRWALPFLPGLAASLGPIVRVLARGHNHIFPLVTDRAARPRMWRHSFSAAGRSVIEPHRRVVVAAIDDDEGILWSLGSLLESANYAVRLFTSAGAFLQSDWLGQVDCLISDIDMPSMDGLELLRVVREKRPALPTILVTGYPDRVQRCVGAGAGVGVVFTKPFHGPQLLAAVGEAVRASRP